MTSNLLAILAQSPPPPPGGIFSNQMLMIPLMVIMFYFLLIRPQQKQKKEMAARIASLQNGDKIVTTAGIHGIVHNVRDHTVMIKIAEGTIIEFDKAAVAVVHKKETEAK